MSWNNPLWMTIVWSGATIATYLLARKLYRRWPAWWMSPLAITPLLLLAATLLLHVSYSDYIRSTHWLVMLMGPATVAFAIPLYEHRALIQRHWAVLAAGIVVGSAAAMSSGWALAYLFDFNDTLRDSLIPRSMTTPFAMSVSADMGGIPELTAIFVVVTGVFGAVLGQIVLHYLPLQSVLARGALFGVGAHGAGVAKAREVGREEGAVAGLAMVMMGIFNILLATLLLAFLGK
jgi:predicted murein hydrolase (TIGR00659 family)